MANLLLTVPTSHQTASGLVVDSEVPGPSQRTGNYKNS